MTATTRTEPMLYARDDAKAQEVAGLVEQGMDQIQASRLVFSNDPPEWDAGRRAWSMWVTWSVTNAFAPLAKTVGL